MWKLHDFAITQILREINFGDYGSAKTAVFAMLEALNFANLVSIRAKIQIIQSLQILIIINECLSVSCT